MVEYQTFKKGEPEKAFKVLICSGKGLGAGFVNSLNTQDPIIVMLGTTPFPGTHFVQLKSPIYLRGLPYPGNNGEVVKIVLGSLEGRVVVAKWTKKYPKNLQLVSSSYLRNDLNLVDGQYSQILFAKGDILANSPQIYWLSFLQWAKTTRLADLRRTAMNKLRGRPKI